MRSWLRSGALVAALALAPGVVAVSGCATIQTTPDPTTVEQTQRTAIRIFDETTRGVNILRTLRTAAENLTQTAARPGLPLTAAQMDTIDRDVLVLAGTLRTALTVLRDVATGPQLLTTVAVVVSAIDAFLGALPAVGQLAFIIEILRGTFAVSRATVAGGL